MIDWLPELILLEHAHGNWEYYLELVYGVYQDDFIFSEVNYKNIPVYRRRLPISEGKENAFWHLISCGDIEDKRNIDIRRCERIKWPKPIIEKTSSKSIWIWKNKRKSEERILLYIHEERYLVVLGVRSGYLLLCTAYLVERTHQHENLQAEYEEYLKYN